MHTECSRDMRTGCSHVYIFLLGHGMTHGPFALMRRCAGWALQLKPKEGRTHLRAEQVVNRDGLTSRANRIPECPSCFDGSGAAWFRGSLW
eukprot:15240260-Alexandrium_andersonii.AAC.1